MNEHPLESSDDEIFLSALFDDELSSEEAKLVEESLSQSEALQDDLAFYRELTSIISDLEVPVPSSSRWDQFEDDFDKALSELDAKPLSIGPRPAEEFWNWRNAYVPFAAAAAFFLSLILLGSGMTESGENIALAYTPFQLTQEPFRKKPVNRVVKPAASAAILDKAQQQFKLTVKERAELGRHLLSLRRDASTGNLVDRYETLLKGKDAVLITPELATILYEGSARRVARDVELYEIQPRLQRLIRSSIQSIKLFHTQAKTRESRVACERALEYLGTAATLFDLDLTLSPALTARCREEVGRIERAEGSEFSEILGREVDYSAFQSRSPYLGDVELRRFERVIYWFGRAPLSLKASESVETRAAMILVAAAAHAKEFATWNTIDQMIALLFGPRDDLSLLDMRLAMQSTLGYQLKSVDQISSPGVTAKISGAMSAAAKFHNKGLISGAGTRGGASLRLLGGTRNPDALAASFMTGGSQTFLRPHARLLDFPVVLGHGEAQRLLVEDEDDGAVLVDKANQAKSLIFMEGALSFIEGSRLKASAALLETPVSSVHESRRLLSASLASLDERGRALDIPKKALKTGGSAPVYVEAYPEFFDRYVYASSQLLKNLRTLKVSRKLQPAIADLQLIHFVLRVMALRAREAAEGRGKADLELGLTLRRILPAFSGSAQWTVRTLNEVKYPDGMEYSQRLIGGADTLVRLVLVQENGQRVYKVTQGYVLSARENYGAKRLGPDNAGQADRPLWMLDWSH
ncbi:MAG: DUF3160 domain-containing protein [Planctomycetota bacterium]|nr:DUF3160 domain-containing protein [Planctomycetota bacterium]